ncbi:MAG: sulfatase [Candidatus Omnitrophica bacterium]|nr:sulfatase [Candidatus Omnitrophota bacterium]
MSEFEGKLVDLYLVSPRSLAVVLGDLEVAGMGSCPEGDLNILLVVIDTLRADHLGCSGNLKVQTPVMDRLAREGVRFTRAFTHIPITGPSHTTLFTSRYASEAGVRNNGQAIPYEESCLAEAMQYAGRSTFGFISMTVLGKSFHFDQGFEVYRDELPPPWMLSAVEVNARVEEELLNHPRETFFAFVHYCEPHEPYSSHGLSECRVMARRGDEWLAEADIDREIGLSFKTVLAPGVNPIRFSSQREFRLRGCSVEPRPNGLRQIPGSGWKRDGRGILSTRDAELAFHVPGEETTEVTIHAVFSEILSETESRRNYALEVEAVDTALGELLERFEAAGLLERTLVILTSDHGESLGEHGHMGHVEQLYDPLMAVPLILRFPDGRHAGRTVEDLAALSDIPPTVFDLLDIVPPSKPRGISLLPLIEGNGKGEGRALFLETYRPEAREDKVGIRTPFRKLIRTLGAETEEVYDLQNDPGEQVNILERDPLTNEKLRLLLAEQLGEGAAGPEAPTPRESFLDEDAKEALKALGYFR